MTGCMEQYTTLEIRAGKRYMASRSTKRFISSQQDILDLLALGYQNETNLLLLKDTDFDARFYDLSTGLAGEILQTVSNYRARLAIVGTFAMVKSKRFGELVAESNQGLLVRCTQSPDEAVSWLVQ